MDEKKYLTCTHCGCVIEMNPDDVRRDPHDEPICDTCFDELCAVCDECGDIIWAEDVVPISGRDTWVCPECARDNYYRCDECGDWYSYRDIVYDGNLTICEWCSDEYRRCDECGDIIRTDDAFYDDEEDEYYCSECYQARRGVVHGYSYRPTPRFFTLDNDDSDNCMMYGVELEIDDGDYTAHRVAEDLEDVQEVYCKHDGSLNDGVEIVTHPLSIAYHMSSNVWPRVLDTAHECGFKSHDTSTCGLHVHANRHRLPDDAPEKILAVVDSTWGSLVQFSRRREGQLTRWAAKPDSGITARDTAEDAKDKARKTSYKGRYQAINLTNYHTIEFRIFRGTLRLETLLASIQLVDAICEYTKTHTVAECAAATFRDVVDCTNYTELKAYSTQRGIY